MNVVNVWFFDTVYHHRYFYDTLTRQNQDNILGFYSGSTE